VTNRVGEARNKERRENYASSRKNATGGYRFWTQQEDREVIAHAISDRELSRKIGRSVQAIQIRRSRLPKPRCNS
jgi:hypothetical protein